MDAVSVLVIVLIVSATVTCGVAIFVLLETKTTMRSAQVFFDDMDNRLIPLIEKADITVDAVNAELLRIDAIITQVEDVAGNVSTASNVVRGAANAPGNIANAVSTQVRRLVRDLKD